jgi:hypothetical protein
MLPHYIPLSYAVIDFAAASDAVPVASAILAQLNTYYLLKNSLKPFLVFQKPEWGFR